MRQYNMMNKKAVSLMIAYVLLIVISITISFVVYSMLKSEIPTEQLECPEDISVIIKDYTCGTSGEIIVTFQNKGLQDVDGVYVRVSKAGESGESHGLLVKETSEYQTNLFTEDYNDGSDLTRQGMLIFGRDRILPLTPKVRGRTSDEYTQSFSYTGPLQRIQVEAIVFDQETNDFLICEESIISQDLTECD